MKSGRLLVLLAAVFLIPSLHAQVSRRQTWQQQSNPDNTAFDRVDPFATIHGVAAVNPNPAPSGGIIPASQLLIPGKALKEYDRSLKAYNSGDLASSAEHLQKALEIYPQFLRARNALGLRYMQMREYEKALAEHQFAVTLSPADSDAHADLSLDLLLLNRNSEAEREARQSLNLAPQATGPRYFLGRALIAQHQFTPEALRMLKESENAFPNASLVLAQVYFTSGNTDETINHLRQYLRAPTERENQHKAECWLASLTGHPVDAACADVPARPAFK
jgi:tetratricopeptide (TPR) repeat protein